MGRAVSALLCLWAFAPLPAAAQGPAGPVGPMGKGADHESDFTISTEFPGLDKLTRRDSEASFFQRLQNEAKSKPGAARVFFPEYAPITKQPFEPRQFPPMVEIVEPLAMQHGRLLFEQPNFERHGWDLGILTPAVNLGVFYYDVLALPYHYWTRPCQRCDSSAGKCLPGDPTPLYLYREQFSLTGLAGQAATVVGGFFVFP